MHIRVIYLCLCLTPQLAQAAVYKCADGLFQDKPCENQTGDGLTKTRTEATKSRSIDEVCVAAGKEAERVARAKADDASVTQLLIDADAQDAPYARKQTQKKLIQEVFRSQGTPAQIAAQVESDCVISKAQTSPNKR